jgi:hypothetical protein
VRWYLRHMLSYCDVEELLVERGAVVDHVTVYRGCTGSLRYWPTRPGLRVVGRATGGSSTRRTSGSTVSGATVDEVNADAGSVFRASQRLRCAIRRTCAAAVNGIYPNCSNPSRNPSTYPSNGPRTLAQYGMLTISALLSTAGAMPAVERTSPTSEAGKRHVSSL